MDAVDWASQYITEEIDQNIPEAESVETLPSWKVIAGEWLADVVLFCSTAVIVIWQNSRITVLYDLCGVLEPAYRMSVGDRPYVDFPFPYAPLTFLIQAAIIKVWGTVYWYHIAYVAIAGGVATVLTWRLLVTILRDSLSWPRVTAFFLTLPVTILGIYCVFPHPFYDPDATLFVLLSLVLILWCERHEFPLIPTFFAGMLSVVPLFVKQNIGLAFLGSGALSLLVVIVISFLRKRPVKGYLVIVLGVIAGLAVAFVIIQSTVGIENYTYWTWTFAKARRTPSILDMLSVYQDPLLILWLIVFAIGVTLFWINKNANKLLSAAAVTFLSAPFAWPVIYLLVDEDSSERAERLANLWPLILIAAFVLWLLTIRRRSGSVRGMLAFVVICTAHGVFLSQQLWGSTYGIWPLFTLLIGLSVYSLNELAGRRSSGALTVFALIASACLITAGAFYVYSNERLDYIDFEDGEFEHSTLPQLKGLTVRGSYLPDFEELVRYTNENIPLDDGVLELPGEDLFYYTTHRRPVFPTLLFDITNNPYSAEEIAELARERDIRWLIVKNDLQIDVDKPAPNDPNKPTEVDKTIDDKDHILEVLKPEFKHVESLNNYEIYRRRQPGETDDDDEDDNGDDPGDDSGN